MKSLLSIACGVMLAVSATAQQAAPQPPWILQSIDAIPITVPAVVRRILDLEYDDSDIIKGVRFDLNADGIDDYIVQSSPRLCGTGGCAYSIVDGASRKGLGQMFGNSLHVRSEKTSGYPIVETYSHQSARSGNLTIYNFDGKAYAVKSKQLLEGAAVDELFDRLSRVPRWRPRR